MENIAFKAMIVTETADKQFIRTISDKHLIDLPEGQVLIKVRYSSLNYKDALSASGNKGVTRKYPHTPGIDAAGLVAKSSAPAFKPGDQVLVTGYEVAAVTTKIDQKPYLRQLGAKEVISAAEADDQSGRPMLKPRWAGVID